MSADQLEIRVQHTPEALIVAVLGELDIASAGMLERAVRDAELDAPGRLVVDLSGLDFMDSTGLHVLLAAARRSRDGGPRLTLRRGPGPVHQVFELTQTTPLFHFER
ncbi:MAG TPA: STAS domain-containing protein [Solirubrobacteraceae bacterium]|nr:STAS domain-containing protein [Solirubrobacteraceae bacterium]